jgi:cation transport ATPase
MAQLDVVVFDKTGTLTEGGEPRVSDFEVFGSNEVGFGREVVLGIAAEIESTSSHPLAIAVRHFCDGHGASSVTGSDFAETAGRGLKAYFEALRCTAIIGNEAWVQDHGVVVNPDAVRKLEDWKAEAKSIILLALRHEVQTEASFHVAAIFAVTDPLRPEANDVIKCLQEQGVGTWMISGDNVITAKAVAKTVGIPEANVIAGVLPHEKVFTSATS